ncbi:hypothetical protein GCM10010149_63620 [Nonomuraea roseoviolacea subsp. roseoviolacea]|uniref:Uncharacterized protein n=1 Tax=Nonomuraea roseoviolacea subsp. carminata TaxID=160689 RepID=A0ABT1K6V8_9ACTN|nr:hypothetical protein [Nonomuraea roseoviolacea]MCP2349738.1 hypothetical protein [Nonomuraea roseoviolacea subsp. carminata]
MTAREELITVYDVFSACAFPKATVAEELDDLFFEVLLLDPFVAAKGLRTLDGNMTAADFAALEDADRDLRILREGLESAQREHSEERDAIAGLIAYVQLMRGVTGAALLMKQDS